MKNKFLQKLLLGILVVSSAFFSSCSDDDSHEPVPGQQGFFIVNEGGFGNGDASLSYFDKSSGKVINDLFVTKTGRPLGDQAQSMTVFNGSGYIVVQNSAKVEVINATDFSSIGTIGTDEGIVSPRYFIGLNADKGYVSDWGADGVTGTVKVIDLKALEVSKTIHTGQGANGMLLIGNKLYVANNGGWGSDNAIAVIDVQSDEVVKHIIVGDNPGALVQDANNNIWVTGRGKTAYNDDWSIDEANSTPGFIAKINANDEVVLKLEADRIGSAPGNLVTNKEGNMLYYTYAGAVYRLDVSATSSPEAIFIEKSFYGLSVDPSTNNIIGTEAPNFSSAGTVYRYTSEGELIDEFTTGIAPNGCAFK